MTKEQIERALEIGQEEMCSPEMIENCVFCREFMTPAMEALRKIEQLKRERDAAIENLSENLRIAYKQRDAAIKDLEEIMFYGGRNIDTCDYCKNAKCYGRGGRDLCDPEWRGIQKEER